MAWHAAVHQVAMASGQLLTEMTSQPSPPPAAGGSPGSSPSPSGGDSAANAGAVAAGLVPAGLLVGGGVYALGQSLKQQDEEDNAFRDAAEPEPEPFNPELASYMDAIPDSRHLQAPHTSLSRCSACASNTIILQGQLEHCLSVMFWEVLKLAINMMQ